MKDPTNSAVERPDEAPRDPWHALTRFTPARIALGRAGGSQPTGALLRFQLAHAQARDAVHRSLDVDALLGALAAEGFDALALHSKAADRATFTARPDLGRRLDDASKGALATRLADADSCDCVFVIADGLSALAIERHALALLSQIRARMARDWRSAPVCVVRQARVAIGDEVGALARARMTVLLVGERPGLSSPDSLGIYLTWDPKPGRSNAERNCISNIRPPAGLSYEAAADTLHYLMLESRRRRLSGVALKDDRARLAEPVRRSLPDD